MLAASLTRSAFSANAARASPNDFVTAAVRTDDVHEHVAECFLHAIGVTAPIRCHLRRAVVWRMTRDYVDEFLLSRARQIRHRPVQRPLFHLGNFLQRQLGLTPARRCRFFVAFDELAGEPAKNVVGDAGRVANIGIFREPARFKSLVSELLRETLQRHAVLQRNRSESAYRVH